MGTKKKIDREVNFASARKNESTELGVVPINNAAIVPKAELESVAGKLDVAILPDSVRKQIRELGIELDEAGAMNVAGGLCYVTAQFLVKAASAISQSVIDTESAMAAAKPLKDLAAVTVKLAQEIKKGMPVSSPAPTPQARPRLNPFPTGQPVSVVQNIYYGPNKEKVVDIESSKP